MSQLQTQTDQTEKASPYENVETSRGNGNSGFV